MKAKKKERIEARKLRKRGFSLNAIASKLIVSKSTVSQWVRDIQLTHKQKRELLSRSAPFAAKKNAQARQSRIKKHQEAGRELAIEKSGIASFIAGTMLYWAEGTKSKNQVDFTNSDLSMVKFFVKYLKVYFKVPNEKISIQINCYTDVFDLAEIESHWIKELNLPRTCLRKSTVNHRPASSKQTKRRKLPYGVCKLRVNSTEILHKIYGAIWQIAHKELRLDQYNWPWLIN